MASTTEMAPWQLSSAVSALVLDHIVGDRAVPTATADALRSALPSPSHRTLRLRRSSILRLLASDPISESALDHLSALVSYSPAPAVPAFAAAHLAVAAHLAASAADFDAAARDIFGGRALEGALASAEAVAVAGQFAAAVGNAASQAVLKGLWGDRTASEELVMELVDAEWSAIGPSRLEEAAEWVGGAQALQTWRAADEATRAIYLLLVGEKRAREVQGRPEDHVNPISTPEYQRAADALKKKRADLHSVVEDLLPAAKAAAQKVANELLAKGVNRSDVQWESSSTSEGSRPRPHLPTPRRVPPSPLQPPEHTDFRGKRNHMPEVQQPGERKKVRRTRRRWSSSEEEALRNGVEKYGAGCWRCILDENPDAFNGRTIVDLKDKWRNITISRNRRHEDLV